MKSEDKSLPDEKYAVKKLYPATCKTGGPQLSNQSHRILMLAELNGPQMSSLFAANNCAPTTMKPTTL
ncbi:hypothetical protein PspS35_07685 [Pseudomonas sp. S35]|nr:hypothetical protein PspS35_07685 [Pseudomonas sp. S35]